MDTMGNMTGPLEEFHGMPRFTARAAIVASLQARGLLDGIDDHSMVVKICSRSGDVIEPMLSWQWYDTFRPNFHRFDRFELDLRGHTQP